MFFSHFQLFKPMLYDQTCLKRGQIFRLDQQASARPLLIHLHLIEVHVVVAVLAQNFDLDPLPF
jgi:hypothetical protein